MTNFVQIALNVADKNLLKKQKLAPTMFSMRELAMAGLTLEDFDPSIRSNTFGGRVKIASIDDLSPDETIKIRRLLAARHLNAEFGPFSIPESVKSEQLVLQRYDLAACNHAVERLRIAAAEMLNPSGSSTRQQMLRKQMKRMSAQEWEKMVQAEIEYGIVPIITGSEQLAKAINRVGTGHNQLSDFPAGRQMFGQDVARMLLNDQIAIYGHDIELDPKSMAAKAIAAEKLLNLEMATSLEQRPLPPAARTPNINLKALFG